MATHSSKLAWEITRTEEPGKLLSMGATKSQTWLSDETTIGRGRVVWNLWGFFSIHLFIWLHQVLIVAHGLFNLHHTMRDLQPWRVGSSSLTKDPTWANCIGSAVLTSGPPGKSQSHGILEATVKNLNGLLNVYSEKCWAPPACRIRGMTSR